MKPVKNLHFVLLALMVLIVPAVLAAGPVPPAAAHKQVLAKASGESGAGMAPAAVSSVPSAQPVPPELRELREKIRERIQARNIEECIKRAGEKFPQASKERIEQACKLAFENPKEFREKAKELRKKGDDNGKGALSDLPRNAKEREERIKELREKIKERAGKYLDPAFIKKVESRLPPEKLRELAKIAEKHPEFRQNVGALTAEDARKFAALPAAMQAEMLKNPQWKEKLKEVRLVKNPEDVFKKRVLSERKIREADKRFKTAVQEYRKIAGKYGEKKSEFNEIKDRVKEACRDDPESEECQQAQQEALEKAKEFLSEAIDMQIVYLEKLKSRIEASDFLSEEEAQEIISEIDELISKLEDLKEKVAEAETKEDIKEIAKELKELAKKVKYRAQVHAGRIISDKVGEIVVRSEQLEKKLDCVLTQMEAQGIDTAAIDLMVEDFSKKVQSAKDNWELAKKYFDEAENLKLGSSPSSYNQVRQLVNLGKARVKEAHDDLAEAHKLLKEILQAIRDEGGSITGCSDEESGEVAVISGGSDDDSDESGAAEEEEEETNAESEDEGTEETNETAEDEQEDTSETGDSAADMNESDEDASDNSSSDEDSTESGEGSTEESDETGDDSGTNSTEDA